jgi:hypothetical protein
MLSKSLYYNHRMISNLVFTFLSSTKGSTKSEGKSRNIDVPKCRKASVRSSAFQYKCIFLEGSNTSRQKLLDAAHIILSLE